MDILNRMPGASVVFFGALLAVSPAWAETDSTTALPSTPATAAMGSALSEQTLTDARGGTEVVNDMTLNGVVVGNQAYNLSTGNNSVTDGALSGSSGMPTLIQNSGNNVLIQNATIVNVQLQ